jgi:hypothetical protein
VSIVFLYWPVLSWSLWVAMISHWFMPLPSVSVSNIVISLLFSNDAERFETPKLKNPLPTLFPYAVTGDVYARMHDHCAGVLIGHKGLCSSHSLCSRVDGPSNPSRSWGSRVSIRNINFVGWLLIAPVKESIQNRKVLAWAVYPVARETIAFWAGNYCFFLMCHCCLGSIIYQFGLWVLDSYCHILCTQNA